MNDFDKQIDDDIRNFGKHLAYLIDDDNANPRDRFALQVEFDNEIGSAKDKLKQTFDHEQARRLKKLAFHLGIDVKTLEGYLEAKD